mgnify:CR=1 FL=1
MSRLPCFFLLLFPYFFILLVEIHNRNWDRYLPKPCRFLSLIGRVGVNAAGHSFLLYALYNKSQNELYNIQ